MPNADLRGQAPSCARSAAMRAWNNARYCVIAAPTSRFVKARSVFLRAATHPRVVPRADSSTRVQITRRRCLATAPRCEHHTGEHRNRTRTRARCTFCVLIAFATVHACIDAPSLLSAEFQVHRRRRDVACYAATGSNRYCGCPVRYRRRRGRRRADIFTTRRLPDNRELIDDRVGARSSARAGFPKEKTRPLFGFDSREMRNVRIYIIIIYINYYLLLYI